MTGVHAVAAAVTAFALTVGFTPPLIRWLRARQLGKAIRADGPDHRAKAGTPTMGGLGMLGSVAVVAGALATRSDARLPVAIPVVAMAAFALLGLVDDLGSLARRTGAREEGVGLSARAMFGLQAAVGTVIGWWVHASWPELASSAAWVASAAPGSSWGSDPTSASPQPPAILLSAFVIMGAANGVNLADGLDGLAAGLAAVAFVGMGLAAAVLAAGWPPAAVLAMSLAGACAAFLLYNRHPAQVFMGNVASLALGAGLGAIALVTNAWPLLAVVGAVFATEVASDIVQVVYYRWSGGRRVFRMAPLHHHFELGGRSEAEVVHGFWLAGLVAAVLGIALATAWRAGGDWGAHPSRLWPWPL